jgi:hypothetical protein
MLKTARKKTHHESTKSGKHENRQLGLSNLPSSFVLSYLRVFVVASCPVSFAFFSILQYSYTTIFFELGGLS